MPTPRRSHAPHHQEARDIPALPGNAFFEPLEFKLPLLKGECPWRRSIEKAFVSPHDLVAWQESPGVLGYNLPGGVAAGGGFFRSRPLAA